MGDQAEPGISPVLPQSETHRNGYNGHDIELSQKKSLSNFASNMRAILDGYRQKICSEVLPDGTFIDKKAEQEAIENWRQWQHIPTLPQKKDNNTEAWISEVRIKLDEIEHDPTQTLTFADRATLIEYYKTKYPQDALKIDDIFASFNHDVNLVSGGINAAFSDDENERTNNSKFRKKPLLQWPADLLELTAQELEGRYLSEGYDLIENLQELQELFQAVSEGTYAVEIHLNDPQHYGTRVKGSRLAIKKAIYNLLRNVQKHTTSSKHHKSIITVSPVESYMGLTMEDDLGGFRDDDEQLISNDPNTPIVTTRDGRRVRKRTAFELHKMGVSSTGTGRGLHTVWKTIVDGHNGRITVKNIMDRNDNAIPTGARFSLSFQRSVN